MIYVVIRTWSNDYEVLGVFDTMVKLKNFLVSLDNLDNVMVDRQPLNVKILTQNSKPATEYV